MPKSMSPPTPAATAARASDSSESSVCCFTPGIEVSSSGSSRLSFTNIGRMRSAAWRRFSLTRRRSAGVVRSLRGRVAPSASW